MDNETLNHFEGQFVDFKAESRKRFGALGENQRAFAMRQQKFEENQHTMYEKIVQKLETIRVQVADNTEQLTLIRDEMEKRNEQIDLLAERSIKQEARLRKLAKSKLRKVPKQIILPLRSLFTTVGRQ